MWGNNWTDTSKTLPVVGDGSQILSFDFKISYPFFQCFVCYIRYLLFDFGKSLFKLFCLSNLFTF